MWRGNCGLSSRYWRSSSCTISKCSYSSNIENCFQRYVYTMFNYDTYTYTFILLGCQVDIKPEQVDVGVQCDLPCHPKKTLSIGMQSGVPNPLAASSPRTIPTSCSESYTVKAFMMCNAVNVICTLLKLVYNSFYFRAANALTVSWHYFTFSALAPTKRVITNAAFFCSKLTNPAVTILTSLYCAVVLQLRVRHWH